MWIEIKSKRHTYLFIIILSILILKFKRLSEFGYDYIGQFILIYLFCEFILRPNKNILNNAKYLLIFSTTLLIKISNVYFLPIIISDFIIQNFSKKKLLIKKIILPLILIFFTFSVNSFLKTGCLNYLFKFTCISSESNSWVYDYSKIESAKNLAKNWSRGFYHQKENILSETEYNNNFNWTKNWFKIHFLNKILPFTSLVILISLIIKFLVFENKFLRKKNEILLIGIFLSLLIWFMNFPQYRFGFTSILIFILMLINFVIGESAYYNKKKLIIMLSIFIIYFNASNIIRIHKNLIDGYL